MSLSIGEHDDLPRRQAAADLPAGGKGITRELEAEEADVRLLLNRPGDRPGGVVRFLADDQTVVGRERGAQSRPNCRILVRHQEPNLA